jgi:pimeloyl-ACP methyl ester carboxylesterase
MNSRIIYRIFTACLILTQITAQAQIDDSIILKDIQWDKAAPATTIELSIPSEGSLMAGFIYTANGKQKHPTLLLLHGYPGNERNLDLGQVVRAHGWNVIYFDYRGSWGSQGQFSLKNCVQDVGSVVAFCKKYSDSLRIDTSNIVLFGHSLGGWICLKALAELPGIKKGFAISAANFYQTFKSMSPAQLKAFATRPNNPYSYFVLNSSVEQIFSAVIEDLAYFNLDNDNALSGKQFIMIDENNKNKELAESLRKKNNNYFDYEVWQTDHGFTNKRISLINKVIAFLKL